MSVPHARVRLALPAAVGLYLAGGLVAVHLALHTRALVDLRVYLSGAEAVLHGADVSAAHPAGSDLQFTYPPFAALCFLPLVALHSLPAAGAAMTAASMAALVLVVRLALHEVRPQWTAWRTWTVAFGLALAALPLDPVRNTLGFGQVNLVLLALVLADALAPPGRRGRGALVGLAAGIKLTPAIFVGYFAVTRQWRAARNAALSGVGTVLAGWVAAPASTVRYWTRLVLDPDHIGGIPYAGNQSLYAVATRLGHGQQALRGVWMAAAALVVVVGLAAARRAYHAGNRLAAACLTGLTGLLVSPVSWSHHWVWLVPGVIALWGSATRRRAGAGWLAAGLLALFYAGPIWWVPRTGNREYDHHGVQLLTGNAYVLAGLVLLAVATPAWRAAPRTGWVPGRRRPAVRPPAGPGRGTARPWLASRPAVPRPRPAPPGGPGASPRTPARRSGPASPPRPPAAAAPPRAPGSSHGPRPAT